MSQDFPWVYRISRTGRNFYLVLGLLCIGMGVTLYIGIGATSLGLLLFLFCLALGAPGIASACRTRVVVTEDTIEVWELFSVKSMRRSEVAGFRKVQEGERIRLETGRAGLPTLTLPAHIVYDSRMDEWLSGKVNYDQQERQAPVDAVLNAPELAGSTGERLAALRRAWRVARIVTASSLILCFWALLDPSPYDVLMLLVALCPWIAVGIALSSPALYRVNPLRNDMGADLSTAICLPAVPLMMRGIFGADVLDGGRLFFLTLGGAVLLTAVLVWLLREIRSTGATLCFGLIMAGYAYGVTRVANVGFDRGEPATHEVEVLGQHNSGSGGDYYLQVSPWGPRTEAEDVNVSRSLYEGVSRGDKVCVYLRPGALGVRWYWVGKCQA